MTRHSHYILIILFFSTYCIGQTSMQTEIRRIDLPKDFILKNEIAKEIIVTKKINPGQDFSYVEKTIYTFPKQSLIRTKRYKNSKLESTKDFSIDSLNRVIKNIVRFKHKALGWQTSKYETIYRTKTKDLKMLNLDDSVNYIMRVVFDENDNPIEIKTLNSNDKLIGLSTAVYDYDNNSFIYTVFKKGGTIVLNKNEYFKKDYEIQRNEFGDLQEFYWPTSSSNIKYIIEYKYDDKGNWTKMKKLQIDGKKKKTTEIISRKIKYVKI